MENNGKKSVKIRLDGRVVEAPEGSTILEVARREGIYIPTLCYSPLLRPLENCRLCVVSIAGERQYKAACSAQVAEGMDITTSSENIFQTRKLLLELLLDTHYGDCVAPCSLTCPAGVDIQGYLALIRNGEYRDAVRLIKQKIPMPATIGRVCPHTCESSCRRHLVDQPIAINYCKRFLADFEMQSGERILPDVAASSGHRVAVIGGGPAGLSAAYYLRSMGHEVTIMEGLDKLGGMLRYGIPEYRLPKRILDWEIEGILQLGVEVKTGVRWGRDFTIDDLKRDGFDAVLIAVGAWASRRMGIVGEDLQGVLSGVDFLKEIASGQPVAVGRRVVVVGGGNVAIDAARSCLRLGAKEVTILYRRSRKEMPAAPEEIEAAEDEGVNIQYLAAPTHLLGDDTALRRVQFVRMELGEPDASGRRRPVPIEGSEVVMDADQVISAIGQYPDIPLPEMDPAMLSLPLTRWGTIGGDPRSMFTGQALVFVGGDVFHGPLTVVNALADGRKAAFSLNRYFKAGEVQPEPLQFNISKGSLEEIDREPFSVMKTSHRERMPELEVKERAGNFQEVELGFNEELAKWEAERCLVCGCSAAFDCRLRELMNEFQVDWRDQASKKIHYQRVAAVDVHPMIALDPNKCIRCERCHVACNTYQCSDAIEFKDWPRFRDRCIHCGLCVDLCPTGALTEKLEGRAVDRLDWQTVNTHCIHCGCGCSLDLQLSGERLVWIADGDHVPPSWSSTCRRGRFRSYDALWYGQRLEKPLVRRNGSLQEVSWSDAVGEILEGFEAIRKKHGSKALAAMGSVQYTNEALYLLQKWIRTGYQSHGLDFPGRTAQERLWALLEKKGRKATTGEVIQQLSGLESVGAIFMCGDGIEHTAPVVATMIRRTVRRRQIPLWQLASQTDSLSSFASASVYAPPDLWKELLQTGQRRTKETPPQGWQALMEALQAEPSVAFVFPEVLLDNEDTAEAAASIVRLADSRFQSRNNDGTGIYVLTRGINSLGAMLMGVSPRRLPGLTLDKKVKASTGPADPLEAALDAGAVKALFFQQPSEFREWSPDDLQRRLQSVELLVVQDSVPGPVVDIANVVLPTAAFGEQNGTVVNLERRVLPLLKAFDSPGEARADWEVLLEIGTAQGLPFPRDLAAIREEMNKAVPMLARFPVKE